MVSTFVHFLFPFLISYELILICLATSLLDTTTYFDT
jgi:fumarate reductase subunit C